MKILVSLMLLVFIGFMTSCKYEDGPTLSLRSKQHRAVKIWHLNQVIENEADKTDYYKNAWVNYQITLKDNMTYEKYYKSNNKSDYIETGKWAFSSDKCYINFSPKGKMGFFKWEILMLKESEIWVIQTTFGRVIEIHLK